MKCKNSRWTMVMAGMMAFLVLATMVWASAPASGPSAPLQAYDANNADKVDGLHASKRPKANTLLALRKNKKFPASVIPAYTKAQSNARFLNDDQQETISTASTGAVLSVNNIGTGAGNQYGLSGSGEDFGVYGFSSDGTGVGASGDQIGVEAYSVNGTGLDADGAQFGVKAYSSGGTPLQVTSFSGTNLIEAVNSAGVWDVRFKVVRSTGDVYIDGTYYDTGADFAEMMATVEGVIYEPGDLLVIGPDGKPLPSSAPNATKLLGVYSTDPGFVGGVGDDGDTEGKIPVAITGIVPLKVSAENGAILPGDLLTGSSIQGHAMKASPVDIDGITFYLPGTILGKALEPLEAGTGVILVLVTLQ